MKVLISCYACEPLKGSEPGVGWNLSVALARIHDVVVLTRENNREPIEKYLSQHPIDNMEFIYHDLPAWLMWIKRKLGTQIYYFLWSLTSILVVRRYAGKYGFDIFHHLTFNQYRTLSAGYFLDKPFVMGPIGGAETISPIFNEELEASTLRRENYRRSGRDFWLFRWLGGRSANKKAYLFSANENMSRLKGCVNLRRDMVKVIPAIAIDRNDFKVLTGKKPGGTFTMVYAGRAIDWKGLHVFLKALSLCSDRLADYRVVLVGIRSERERNTVKGWLRELKLTQQTELVDFMPRPELLRRLYDASLFVYPAFRDSGSMAVLEACAMACPSVAFDAGGQDAFPDDILIKVPVLSTLDTTIEKLGDTIYWAYMHQEELLEKGMKAREFAMTKMTWERKAEIMSDIYNQIVANEQI